MDKQQLQVSIVVAVFNREDLLDRCMDSLVYQSFEGPFEIILVDDGSTDGSPEIEEAWRRRFPDKIRIFVNSNKGVAFAKNLGISKARGEYVMFVDSDDYVSYNALKNLFSAVDEQRPEMVVSPIWRVERNKRKTLGSLNVSGDMDVRMAMLRGDYFFLHGKLIRRDLFESLGPLPELGISEDISWVFPAITRIAQIRYVPRRTYYYEYSHNSITTSEEQEELVHDAVTATRLIIENSAPGFREYALRYAVSRAIWFLVKRFPHHRTLIGEGIRRVVGEMDASELLATGYPKLVEQAHAFLDSLDEKPLYPDEERGMRWRVITEKDVKIPTAENMPEVVLEAWKSGNDGFVRDWAVLRDLVENGGFYIHSSIVLSRHIDDLPIYEALMVYSGDEKTISDRVFACAAGNPIFAMALESYGHVEFGSDSALADRLRCVAVGGAGMPLERKSRFINAKRSFCVLPTESFILNPFGETDVDVYGYDKKLADAWLSSPLQGIADASFRRTKYSCKAEIAKCVREQDLCKRKYDLCKRKFDSCKRERKARVAEIRKLKSSVSYRVGLLVTWPMRKIFRALGK